VRNAGEGDVQVTVIVPGPARMTFAERVRRGRSWTGLVHPLRGVDNVSVAVIRDHGGTGHSISGDRIRVSPRSRHIAVILAGRLDRSVLKAIQYARQIEAIDIRALHAGLDPQKAADLLEQWGN